MEGEGTKYAKKKNRLSQVVEKLSVIGNGNVFSDKENNNVTEGPLQMNEALKHLLQTPQLASTVPQIHQMIQPDSIMPQFGPNIPKLPTSMHTYTPPPSIRLPQIGATVPDILPILPVSGSTTFLQNILLYGRGDVPPPPLYGVNNPALNLWQFYLNSQHQYLNNNVLISNVNELAKLPNFSNELKQEPDDDEGNMVIDEMWTDENGDNSGHQLDKTNENLQNDSKMNLKNVIKIQESTNQEFPSTSFSHGQQESHAEHQDMKAAAQGFKLKQAPMGNVHDSLSHIPVPAMPSHTRSVVTVKSVKEQQAATQKMLEIESVKPKTENLSRYTDMESESSWMGSSSSLQSSSENGDQHQQSPLDLSVKGLLKVKNKKPRMKVQKKVTSEIKRSPSHQDSILYPEVRGDVASPTTRESVAARYNMDVSPVVEQMPAGSDTAWACPVCGQLFSKKDRLSKHVACRHRGPSSSKTHVCWSCNRAFSRSDMLTRHLRLHTGQKPYRCEVCGQIFSRSDHLATHRRTHTGEKPYKCPQCSYSACRRDMITRHMRTHRTSASKSPSSSKSSPPLSTA